MTTGTDVMMHEGGALQALDPFQMMDRWDEEAMLAEMQGAIAKSLVYEFNQGGQTITGLSKIGVDECCAALVKDGQVIREFDVSYEIVGQDGPEVERYALFKAHAARFAVAADGTEVKLDEVIGVKREPLYRQTRSGSQFNPHWYETGAMKACRNARFRLIPSRVREGVIAAAKQAGHVRTGQAVNPTAAAPPPAGAPRANADGRPVLPFGKSKGTPLADLDTDNLRGALEWAVAKDKFAEFQADARAELAGRGAL